ncbi:MAG: hypothetical protein ACI4DV_06215 [Lachnospiraceae bacterium]
MKRFFALLLTLTMLGSLGTTAFAAEEEVELTDTMFRIGSFTYDIIDADQSNMPNGFTIGTYDFHGTEVDAGHTENSDMLCMMAMDIKTGYEYRFIYNPDIDEFCPYFGYDIKDGYIYTIPVYEDAEIPFGFEQADYVIQTVPVTVYQREDAELTLEEIALGIISDNAYFVFLMMDENGEEVYYTYDLTDRTFQRALLQIRDAETIEDYNQLVKDLHVEIGDLNAQFTKRMNQRLTVMGVMLAVTFICIGIAVNQHLKIRQLKAVLAGEAEEDGDEPGDDHKTVIVKREEVQETAAAESEEVREESADDDFDDIDILDLDDEE